MNPHSTTTESTAHKVTIEDIFGQATRKLESLLAQLDQATGSNGDNGDGIAELKQLLEALPFSTAEFGLATNRLRNASRYLRSQERGAARYELKCSPAASIATVIRAVVRRPRSASNNSHKRTETLQGTMRLRRPDGESRIGFLRILFVSVGRRCRTSIPSPNGSPG